MTYGCWVASKPTEEQPLADQPASEDAGINNPDGAEGVLLNS